VHWLVAVLAIVAVVGCAAPTAPATPTTRPVASPAPTAAVQAQPGGATNSAGLPVVRPGDLPPEAVRTLALIERGGPFPYRQDGVTFQNREGLLPAQRSGYYREYTVATPGSADRGARRIIAGAQGERYWTADHYDSFAWIAP
jgi:ribonuclease T1